MSQYREAIIRGVLNQMDEHNFHVCGNTWKRLDQLIDGTAGVVGTLDAWIVAVAAEFVLIEDDRIEPLEFETERMAREFLGISESDWCERFEHMPIGIVRSELRSMLSDSSSVEAA